MKHKQGLSELNLLFFHYMATHKHLCVSWSFPIASGAAFSCCAFKGTETYCLYAARSRRSRKLQSCSGWPWERLKSVSRWVSLLRSLEKWLFWPSPSWNVPGESHTQSWHRPHPPHPRVTDVACLHLFTIFTAAWLEGKIQTQLLSLCLLYISSWWWLVYTVNKAVRRDTSRPLVYTQGEEMFIK